jgi:hypothetical protein
MQRLNRTAVKRTALSLALATICTVLQAGNATDLIGGYYRLKIIADGSAELAVEGAAFFRSVWLNEVVINDIEIRPIGLDSLEFDDEGQAEITFIAIKPGQYELKIPGTKGATQRAVFTIR